MNVDLLLSEESGDAALQLTINLLPYWSPKYVFPMVPMAIEKHEALQAQIRDIHEDIEEIKSAEEAIVARFTDLLYSKVRELTGPALLRRQRAVYLVASTSTKSFANGAKIAWDASQKFDRKDFSISSCSTKISIIKSGVYQVQVRIPLSNAPNSTYLSLLVNSDVVAKCYQADPTNYCNTVQLTEIIELRGHAIVEVVINKASNSTQHSDTLGNRIAILLLGE